MGPEASQLPNVHETTNLEVLNQNQMLADNQIRFIFSIFYSIQFIANVNMSFYVNYLTIQNQCQCFKMWRKNIGPRQW